MNREHLMIKANKQSVQYTVIHWPYSKCSSYVNSFLSRIFPFKNNKLKYYIGTIHCRRNRRAEYTTMCWLSNKIFFSYSFLLEFAYYLYHSFLLTFVQARINRIRNRKKNSHDFFLSCFGRIFSIPFFSSLNKSCGKC